MGSVFGETRAFKTVRAFVYAIRAAGGKPSADKVIAMMRAAKTKALHKTVVCAEMRALYAAEGGLTARPELNLNYSEPDSVLKRTESEPILNTGADQRTRIEKKEASPPSLFAAAEVIEPEKPKRAKRNEPTPTELKAYAILAALWPHIEPGWTRAGRTQTEWRQQNKRQAMDWAGGHLTPEQLVVAWQNYSDYDGHRFFQLAQLAKAMARDTMPKVAFPHNRFTKPAAYKNLCEREGVSL